MPRIATIFGSTGLQGMSPFIFFCECRKQPRAVTRNASSAAARALAKIGCEVVEAAFDDNKAIKRAVAGAGVFLVTFPLVDIPEITQGMNVIDAGKEAGVKFFAFSTLPSMSEMSNGKYKGIVHFDDEAIVQKHLEASGISCVFICPVDLTYDISPTDDRQGTPSQLSGDWVQSVDARTTVSFYTWTGRDMGLTIKTLFAQDTTRLPEIDHETFVLGSLRGTVEEMAAELAKGLGKPVEIKRVQQSRQLINDMWFPEVQVPDPRLEALGVKVGTVEEFAKTELRSLVGE
ncbi:NmrA-like domain-containing protein [Schizophyllum amplum]|uniref:NmrA-like domain-containing protein n=1 Tax=Schizophyllum amplum TaxID=97359 RepID=A0A550C596_9AGAR|nr:NmrA-like domain-containing protein [Auriculariopsis ampla]